MSAYDDMLDGLLQDSVPTPSSAVPLGRDVMGDARFPALVRALSWPSELPQGEVEFYTVYDMLRDGLVIRCRCGDRYAEAFVETRGLLISPVSMSKVLQSCVDELARLVRGGHVHPPRLQPRREDLIAAARVRAEVERHGVMDKLTEDAIRAKLPSDRCVPDCDRCWGQGWFHGTKPGPGITVETCPGPSEPMFTMGEVRDALWEIDALRDSLFEAERQLAMMRAGRK